MDSITQAALGAGIAGAMLGRRLGRKALIAGAVLGTLPDLDILIDYGDPLSQMINHRGFSHSVFVLTALSALLTWLVHRWRPRDGRVDWQMFLTIWLVLITHTLLDAFTSYGTQLWWPLRPTPASWSSIFIIDPFYTVPLLVPVLLALALGPGTALRRAMAVAILMGGAYLLASLGFKHWAEARVAHHLDEHGIKHVDTFSAPQPFSILLWRVVVRTDGDDYIEAVTGVFDRRPPEFVRFASNTALSKAIDRPEYIDGLRWFTGNWLRFDAIENQLIVSDLRMGIGSGHYSFRFLVARRNPETGQWTAVTPRYWHGGPAGRDMEALKMVLRRVWQSEPPLPLQQWDMRMTLP